MCWSRFVIRALTLTFYPDPLSGVDCRQSIVLLELMMSLSWPESSCDRLVWSADALIRLEIIIRAALSVKLRMCQVGDNSQDHQAVILTFVWRAFESILIKISENPFSGSRVRSKAAVIVRITFEVRIHWNSVLWFTHKPKASKNNKTSEHGCPYYVRLWWCQQNHVDDIRITTE